MKLRAFCSLIAAANTAVLAVGNTRTADHDHDYDAPVPGSYTLPVIKPAADGALVAPDGRSVRLAELTRGRITVLSFIYTRCAAPLRDGGADASPSRECGRRRVSQESAPGQHEFRSAE